MLSCDGLSSAAYGTEEILYALLPFFGLAGGLPLVVPGDGWCRRALRAEFAMAGFGMARYHRRTREPRWRRRLLINLAGSSYAALVVLLFAVVKFAGGAWLIMIIFPVLVFTLIRLNGEYGAETEYLVDTGHGGSRTEPPNYSRRVVLLLVDGYDLAAIAALKYVISRVPHATATIVPFDVRHRVEAAQAKRARTAAAVKPGRLEGYEWPAPPPETDPIGSLRQPGKVVVQGRLRAAEIRCGKESGSSVLACEVADSTGELTALFLGRAGIAGIEPGVRIRLHGKVGIGADGRPVMTNPAYELLA